MTIQYSAGQAPAARTTLAPSPATAGGCDSLEVLFGAHGAACYRVAVTVLRDDGLAQDAVQEAFLEHWRGSSFDATRSTQRGWLVMLTHRKAIDRVRYEHLRRTAPLGSARELASTRRSPEDTALASVQALKVRAALARLPQVQQKAIALAYWGGYTQVEIAKMLATPLGTVKTRTRNGLIALRDALGDDRD